jgi:hypothetical protein
VNQGPRAIQVKSSMRRPSKKGFPLSHSRISSPSSSSSNTGVALSLLGLSPVSLYRLPWPLGVEAEVEADGRLIRPDISVYKSI